MNLTDKLEKLVANAHFSLRKDLLKALKKAYSGEKNKQAKRVLNWILENSNIAKEENLAICQDTGLPVVFIEVGKKREISYDLVETIKTGVEEGYRKNYLRQSIVDPLKRDSASYEGGIYHLEFSSKVKGIKITILPKGFGSENKSQVKMFNPTVDFKDIEEFIIKVVKEAGPEACPPFVLGIGIGGTIDYACLLAKKALLEDINSKNADPKLEQFQKQLLKRINNLGIGPMGLGGKVTALGVRIMKSPTHIAGLPVAVNISCHALRSAVIKI